MIKAICFDLDGVYFTEQSFKNFKQKIVDLGVDYKEVEYVLHKDPMVKFKKGELGEDEFWKLAIRHWGIKKTPQQVINMLYESYQVNKDVEQTVKKVREMRYKTCVCSNNFVTRVNILNKKFNFLNNFDVAVFSYEVGVLKPNTAIFQVLLNKVGVEPNELVYSDDGVDKIAGALDLGINAFVYKDFNQFKKELVKLGVNI